MILIKNKSWVIFIFILLIIIIIGIINYKKRIKENNNGEEMKVIIGDKIYEVNLENNETVKKLIEILPLDLKMKSLNNNEKYYYLDQKLPINEINVKHINKGDIMLYQDNCLVIFYKSFDTTYSYTKIGHINNLEDLSDDDIKVIFDKG